MGWIRAVTLQGQHVRLEPLALSDAAEMAEAVSDGRLWELWFTSIPKPEHVSAYIERALRMQQDQGALAFVVREQSSGRLLGCTRYFAVDELNQRLEIGHTWYRASAQRGPFNTEAKLLLLSHAFEALQAMAVEFRTHWHNTRSRAAIARLGAKQDGVLRHHQRSADGVIRDTVVFSIIAPEWPAVRQNLRFRLMQG
ncbi:GNAT family N-acetyltransferase [Atopomonas sediminilitoris]|uniref:GNAT family N-acetyltransferase n=1 Tax=Atopomonas sediminilitoris TaxID=2919919 RepID=UPI001F4EC68F|nr:GNAT family protein [Atopomonas sediminilitoris]MCJ8169533.1 GNAT family N-acetyltransferase [Atopomonas sediminilitoris]